MPPIVVFSSLELGQQHVLLGPISFQTARSDQLWCPRDNLRPQRRLQALPAALGENRLFLWPAPRGGGSMPVVEAAADELGGFCDIIAKVSRELPPELVR